MTFDFDHAVFTDDDFLGVDAEFTPSGGIRRSIRVCFTLGTEVISLGGQVMPSDYAAQAGCAFSLVSDVARGDTLTIGTVTYIVAKSPVVDETGWATIFLSEAI
jgi:hypothetical protein